MTNLIKLQVLTNPQQIFDPKYNTSQQLWVVNTSDRGGSQQRGDVLILVKDDEGSDIQIIIPPTWLPIDLTQYANLSVFAKSTNFRTYLRSGLIVVVDEKTAKSLFDRPGAAAEREKVTREMENSRNAAKLTNSFNSDTISLNLSSNNVQVTAQEDKALQNASPDDLTQGNTPKVKAILAKVGNAQPSDMEAVHPELVDFLVSASDMEIKTLAAGVSSHLSPVFAYTDIALNAIVEGQPVTVDMFATLRDKSSGVAVTENITFAVPT